MSFSSLNYRPILFIVGILLLILAGTMIIPALIDFWGEEPSGQSFVGACFISAFAGGICVLAYRCDDEIEFRVRETFFMTAFAWIAISSFAALPFLLSQAVDSFTDGLFEAISALTTTGFTILQGLDYAPQSLLMWRSILQWLGGLGIILMALTLLPFLRIGGMQLFYTEFSDRSEKILPKLSQMTRALLAVYFSLTSLCCFALWWSGFSFFDALCHSMGTVSTGGMSTSSEGIAHFECQGLRWILSFFMILSASPLLLFVRMFTGDPGAYFRDTQVRAYFLCLGVAFSFVVLCLWLRSSLSFWESLTQGVFEVSSVVSTTGFYNHRDWPAVLNILFVIMTILGGCTGSTASGIKIFRLQIVYRVLRAQIYQLLHPHGVFVPVYANRNVPEQVISAVLSFIAIYLFSLAIISLGFALCGVHEKECLSLSVNVLSNSGHGGLPLEGMLYPTAFKWLVILGMLFGRLEFFTLLIVCLHIFWKR
jgi:trk system potassium uptake protein TrkH